MKQAQIGLIGLGTMGAALALNIAEKGFGIAVFNRTTEVTREFFATAGDLAQRIIPTESLADLVAEGVYNAQLLKIMERICSQTAGCKP